MKLKRNYDILFMHWAPVNWKPSKIKTYITSQELQTSSELQWNVLPSSAFASQASDPDSLKF